MSLSAAQSAVAVQLRAGGGHPQLMSHRTAARPDQGREGNDSVRGNTKQRAAATPGEPAAESDTGISGGQNMDQVSVATAGGDRARKQPRAGAIWFADSGRHGPAGPALREVTVLGAARRPRPRTGPPSSDPPGPARRWRLLRRETRNAGRGKRSTTPGRAGAGSCGRGLDTFRAQAPIGQARAGQQGQWG